ncbi:MAG: hypothetical protein PHH04_03835 [Thomasclavelia sp.]|nr:hypothetical protein [Thomasclavelia sp.]
MIKTIKELIKELLKDQHYRIIERADEIVLYGEDEPYPEDYISIKSFLEKKEFVVYDGCRNVRYILFKTNDENLAAICGVIKYKRLDDNLIDRVTMKKIAECVESEGEQPALSFITNNFSDSVYSVGVEEYGKISLIKKDDKIDIKYLGKYIVKDEIIRIAYSVFYNYCLKLKYIKSYYYSNVEKINSYVSIEQVCEWYIFS